MKAPLIEESIFVGSETNNKSNTTEESNQQVKIHVDYGSVIEFVEEALDCGHSESESSDSDEDSVGSDHVNTRERKLPTIAGVAESFKLEAEGNI